MERRVFKLISEAVRMRAVEHVFGAPDGYMCVVSEPTRNLDQNAKFHALLADFVKLRIEWAGKTRTIEEWKTLMVSAHAKATNEECEVVTGLEGELVSLRESTASMSKKRGSSLIEYTTALLETMR